MTDDGGTADPHAHLEDVSYEFAADVRRADGEPGDAGLWRPYAFEVREAIDDLWDATIDLVSHDLTADPTTLADRAARLVMRRADPAGRAVERTFVGVVASARAVRHRSLGAATATVQRARVRLVPELWRLAQEVDCRIFQNLTVVEVFNAVLDRAGLYVGRRTDALRLPRERREVCVQYRETSLDFVRRLLEDEGIAWALEHGDGGERVVLVDAWLDHPKVARLRDEPLRVLGEGLHTAADESLHALDWERRAPALPPAIEDYDFTHPHHLWASPVRDPAARGRGRMEYDYPAGLTWGRYGRGADDAPRTLQDEIDPQGELGRRLERFDGGVDPTATGAPEPTLSDLDPDDPVGRRIGAGVSRDTTDSIPTQISYQSNNLRTIAQARREEAQLRGLVGVGGGNAIGMLAGAVFAVEAGLPLDARPPLLVTRVVHRGVMPEEIPLEDRRNEAGERYRNELECVALGAVEGGREVVRSWRPRRVTERPRIHGAHSAVVSGDPTDAAKDIVLDEHGRVRVRFHWDGRDHEGAPDNGWTSCWIRVMQPWAGMGYGHLFVPRVGMEVVVNFLDGDPDRPVVMGSLYNGWNRPPTANGGFGKLPRDATRSTLRTRSSPNGIGYNELSFEDAIGREEVYLRAERDLREKVLRCQSTSVGADQSTSVGHDQTLSVGHDRTVTVGNAEWTLVGDHWLTATRDMANTARLTKAGEFTVSTTKKVELSAAAEVNLRVGGTDLGPEAWAQLLPQEVTVGVGSGCSAVLKSKSLTLTVGESKIEVTPEKVTVTSKEVELTTGEATLTLAEGAKLRASGNVRVASKHRVLLSGKHIGAAAEDSVEIEGQGPVTVLGAEVKINDP